MHSVTPLEHNRNLIGGTIPRMRYEGEGSLAQWQAQARTQLETLLGLPFVPCEECFTVEYIRSFDTFSETRFVIQTEAGYTLPCHLWVPDGADRPLPVVICLQGHTRGMHISMGRALYPGDEDAINGGDRDFAVRAVREGCCALVIEQRGFGERGGTPDGPDCHSASMAALLIGRTMVGERVWDVMRAIDALERHFAPWADCSRVICLGNSGGGTTTFYAACLDSRIAFAVPSCSFCTYDDSIAAIHHCVCNYIPHIRNYFDMGDLAGLIAPRPLMIACGGDDPIFPLQGVRKAYERACTMYAAADASDHLRLIIGSGGHRFYADDVWPVLNGFIGARHCRD